MTSFAIYGSQNSHEVLVGNEFGSVEIDGTLNGTVTMYDNAFYNIKGRHLGSGAITLEDTDAATLWAASTSMIVSDTIAVGCGASPVGVDIIANGTIMGGAVGIQLAYKGGDWEIDANGILMSNGTAVEIKPSEVGARLELSNTGTIDGDYGITCFAEIELYNSGTISAKKGLDGVKWAIVTDEGNDVVANTGTIDGRVDLGNGNNNFAGLGYSQEWVQTGNGTDMITGGSNGEIFTSLKGNDYIAGYGGDDDISGGAGKDKLFGGSDDDLINGGKGADALVGDEGADRFVFRAGDGKDYIQDFDAIGSEHDTLDIRSVPAVKNFRDFIENHARQAGDGVIISLQTGDSITLHLVQLKDIDASDVLI